MDYYELGKKKAFHRLGMAKHAGMISTPMIAGSILGGGLGAWQAGEGERLKGGLTGGLLGGAGGAIGGAAGSLYGEKALAKALQEAGEHGEAFQLAKERFPEYLALGASTGALTGAGLGAGAGRLMRDDPDQKPGALPAAYGYDPYGYGLGL